MVRDLQMKKLVADAVVFLGGSMPELEELHQRHPGPLWVKETGPAWVNTGGPVWVNMRGPLWVITGGQLQPDE